MCRIKKKKTKTSTKKHVLQLFRDARKGECVYFPPTGCSLSSACLFSACFTFVELKTSQQLLCQHVFHLTNVFSNPSPSSSRERSTCIGMQSRSLNFVIFPAKVLQPDPTSHERLESAGHRKGSTLFCWQMAHLVQSVLAIASGSACLSPGY